MPRDRVEADAEAVTLIIDQRLRDEQQRTALKELILVGSGWDVLSNDETFIVASFASKVWVLPELTHGVNRWLFSHWRAFLSAFPQVYEARLDALPLAWRARRLGIPMPRPRLGSYERHTLPAWAEKSALSFATFPQLGAADD